MSDDVEPLLTAREVAELLSVHESWVRDHTRSGSIPCVRLGRYVRYERAAVLAWLAEQGETRWRKYRPKPAA